MGAAVRPSGSQRRRVVLPVREAAVSPAPRCVLDFLDNPVSQENAALGAALETEARQLLAAEDLGRLEVRFRVCAAQSEEMKFICKIEGPPCVDPESERAQWRWWSPLMETAEDFRSALSEAIRLRHRRLALQPGLSA